MGTVIKLICGIDEAGRGTLAGSMFVAGVILHKNIDHLDDSKKLSSKKRELLYEQIVTNSTYHICSFSSKEIDELGLSRCISNALKQIQEAILADEYIFDGNSSFGVEGIKTIIKADTTVQSVSAASILAKVSKDREMLEYDKIYPQYGFKSHKGYGSKSHIDAIKHYGQCDIHRKSYKIKSLELTLF